MTRATTVTSVLDWAVAERSLQGQTESGDLHLVAGFDGGALVAVIDGLGHGPEAALAARMARAVLAAQPGLPPLELIRRCHAGLRGTRGVVLSLASFDLDASEIAWAGVGDVEGALFDVAPSGAVSRESIILRGGVVGYQLPPLHANRHPVAPGALLVLATDGVRRDFACSVDREREPQTVADAILARHAKGTDDALVLVARYQGSGQ